MANTHYLTQYFIRKGYPGDLRTVPLQSIDINSAKLALQKDKNSFFLNAILTFSACINSINHKSYSWAFIQSYYCLYYLAQSLIANKDIAIVYSNKKAFKIKLLAGEIFEKREGNSHEIVLNIFKQTYANNPMFSNTIDDKDPIEWFKANRELINYRLSPFTDPDPPLSLFGYETNLRRWLVTYISDSNSYSFSKEHAYVAYIYNLINQEFNAYEDGGLHNDLLTLKIINHIKSNITDKRGPITTFISRLEAIRLKED